MRSFVCRIAGLVLLVSAVPARLPAWRRTSGARPDAARHDRPNRVNFPRRLRDRHDRLRWVNLDDIPKAPLEDDTLRSGNCIPIGVTFESLLMRINVRTLHEIGPDIALGSCLHFLGETAPFPARQKLHRRISVVDCPNDALTG